MRCVITSVVLLALLAPAVLADEVVLKNGEVLKGKVLSIEDGKMKVKSESVAEVSPALTDIVTFSTDEAIELFFKDESVYKNKIVAGEEGKIQMMVGPSNQAVTFNIADIDKANPPKVKWEGSLSGAATFTRGNTYINQANLTFDAKRRSDLDRFTFGAFYVGTRERNSDTGNVRTSQRRSGANLQYDLFVFDKVFGYARGDAFRDREADIDVRLIGGVGAGWQTLEQDDLNLSLEAGVSWISENFRSDLEDDRSYFAGQLGYKFDWSFLEYFKFYSTSYFYPALESVGGDIVTSDTGIRASVVSQLFVDFRVLWNWNSEPSVAAEKRVDVSYIFGVGWTF